MHLQVLIASLILNPLVSAYVAKAQIQQRDGDDNSTSQPWLARNLATIQKIYNLTVYPNNVPILQKGASAVPPGLFSKNATGRVSPLGNFTGFDDSIEYFFALAPTPQQSGGVAFYDAQIVAFTSGCPSVAASLIFIRTGTLDPNTAQLDNSKPTSTVQQVAFWKFDDEGAVMKYDAWLPNLGAWVRSSLGADFSGLKGYFIGKGAGAALCPVIQQRCTGMNAQYSSGTVGELECQIAMIKKPSGSFDEAWGDNIACRAIHLILTQVRPEVHCPHVGPNGGSPPDNYKCVDIDYSKEYFDDVQLYGAPLGDVFTCDGPLLG